MKIYLDDTRDTPEGYYRVFTAPGCISVLREFHEQITHLSLDHDLGEYSWTGTGYDVLLFLEENPEFAPPNINIHSANPAVWKKMDQAIKSIHARKENYVDHT